MSLLFVIITGSIYLIFIALLLLSIRVEPILVEYLLLMLVRLVGLSRLLNWDMATEKFILDLLPLLLEGLRVKRP